MTKFEIGDNVRNKYNGEVGVIAQLNPAGMRDCVLVRFTPISDGYCIPRSQLELVHPEKRK